MYALLLQLGGSGKPYGAICISPRILARAGVLEGKNAVGWNKDDEAPDIFKDHGATFVEGAVHVDGNVVTAAGPDAAKDFGRAIAGICTKGQ